MFPLCVIVIVASLLLGGGTRSGFLSDAILQLITIPLLLASLLRLLETPLTKQMRVALFFCLASVAIPLIQLIALPPWLWTALPGREPAVEVFDLLGDKLSWMPISLSPNATWLSVLSLMPPIALFLGTMLSTYRERRWLSLVFLAVGVVSVFLGFIQVAQGEKSPWRFFAYTNVEEAVGFFANKNHFAVLLYALIMFAAAWMVHTAAGVGQQRQGRKYDTASLVPVVGAFTLLVVLLAGQAIARSRLGLGLTIVALLGAVALTVSDRRVGSAVTPTRLIVGAVALVLIFSTQFALYRILERFAQDPFEDGRISFARTTVEAALANMPLGSGLGTSVPVFAMFEKPEVALVDRIVNHHNDVLELWLSTGVMGLILTGMFVVWLLLRSVQIWRKGLVGGASELDWTLARGATVVVALLVAQSFVDSPLRTGGTMAVFAFACAFLVEPPRDAETRAQQTSALEAKIKRLLESPRLAPAATLAAPKSAPVPKPPTPMPLSKPTPTTVPRPPTPMPLSKPAPTTVPNPPTLSKPTPRTHGVDPFLDEMEDRLGHVRRVLAGDAPERAGGVDVEPTPPTVPKPPTPMPLSKPAPASSEAGALPPGRRWGTDINWPEEWSKSSIASSTSGKDKPSEPKPPKGS